MTNTLIVYFSRTGENFVSGELKDLDVGNTEVVANIIQEITGGEMFKIEPEVPYDSNYDIAWNQSHEDKLSNARPAFKNAPATLAKYDTVYLCYPNYWGTMPMHVWTFLEKYNFENKTIKPLCTHEGSRLGTSENDIKKLCPSAKVEKGLAIIGENSPDARERIQFWIDNNL